MLCTDLHTVTIDTWHRQQCPVQTSTQLPSTCTQLDHCGTKACIPMYNKSSVLQPGGDSLLHVVVFCKLQDRCFVMGPKRWKSVAAILPTGLETGYKPAGQRVWTTVPKVSSHTHWYPSSQRVLGDFGLGAKAALSPSSAAVKNEWSCASTLPFAYMSCTETDLHFACLWGRRCDDFAVLKFRIGKQVAMRLLRPEVFWDVTLCRWVSTARLFEWKLCLQLQGRKVETQQDGPSCLQTSPSPQASSALPSHHVHRHFLDHLSFRWRHCIIRNVGNSVTS